MSLFEELRGSTGISGRLTRRRDDPQTWMEVYERVADAETFVQALRAGEARNGLDKLLMAGTSRKIEIFIADVLQPETRQGGSACA